MKNTYVETDGNEVYIVLPEFNDRLCTMAGVHYTARKHHAERLSACWNAFDGVDIKAIRDLKKGKLGEMFTQHAELLAALKKLASEHQELLTLHHGRYPMGCIDYAFQAIHKAQGGKP